MIGYSPDDIFYLFGIKNNRYYLIIVGSFPTNILSVCAVEENQSFLIYLSHQDNERLRRGELQLPVGWPQKVLGIYHRGDFIK